MKQLLLTLLISTSLFSSTQTDVSLKNITLTEALELLKKNNLELTIADYDLSLKKEAKSVAFSHHFGKLDLVQNVMQSNDAGNVFGFKIASREATFGDFGFSDFLSAMPALLGGTLDNDALLATQPDDLNNPEARDFFQTKLSYQLPLYVGGKISAGVDIAKAMQKLASLDQEALELEKIYQVKKSFYDLALLESFINNLSKIHENIQAIETMTNTMVKEGYAKQIDQLQVESKKASVSRFLAQSKANKTLALQFLSFLLNENVASIDTTTKLSLDSSFKEINVDDLVMAQKAKQGLKISENMVSIMRADYLPTLGAFAEISSADDTFGGDFQDHQGYTVGMQLSWNLFDGLGTSSKVEQAKIGRLKAQAQYTLAKKALALQLLKLQTEITSLGSEVTSLEAQIALETKIVENFRDRYAEKLISINDVLMVESARLKKVLELQETANKQNDKILQLHMLTKGN